jgi:SAM-dependent methyltransferase
VEFGSNLAREHGFGNLEYRLGDIEDPPIDQESVDLALFSQALHHASSPQKAVTAAHRILRQGGRIMVLDLASHSHEQARELYADVWLGFSEVELHQILTKAGFSQIEISIVSRETQAPNFQTLLATATKLSRTARK